MDIDKSFNACNLPLITKSVKGLSSNSASPTDTWIITLKDDVTYEGKKVEKVFLKFFIDPSFYHYFNREPVKGLLYEQKVYAKVREMMDSGMCNNFVKVYALGTDCNLNSLESMVTIAGIDKENLYRNIDYMLKLRPGRHAVDNDFSFRRYSRPNPRLRFHYIVNEVINVENRFALTMWDFCTLVNYNFSDIITVLFEQTFACYAMYLNGIAHNDLHMGNSYIIKHKEIGKTYIYGFDKDTQLFDTNSYNTKYTVKVFDFDRAYDVKLGPNKNQIQEQEYSNNTLVPIKDIIKTFCTLYEHYIYTKDQRGKDKVVSILSYRAKDTHAQRQERKRKTIQLLEDKDTCFWGLKNGRALWAADYVKINDNYQDLLTAMRSYMKLRNMVKLPEQDDVVNICHKGLFKRDGSLDLVELAAEKNTVQIILEP